MGMLRTAVLAVGVSLGLAGVPNQTLTVSAAISLTEVLGALATAYSSEGGGQIAFNFGASNLLVRQIVNGAPVDVFVSADEAQMDVAERAGMIEPGSRTVVVHNQLAIVTRGDWAGQIASAAALADSNLRRIAIGDPAAVPAGVYAEQYLRRLGLWPAIQRKLLPAASVRGALAAVANGAADAGIVYATDVSRARNVRLGFVVRGPEAPRIVYPACVVRTSQRKTAALRFVNFLASARAARVFREHGFLPARDSR
jgi:molybdate transport system substrate-binding protein